MGVVRQIALGVLCISFAVFVSFFGSLPVFRRTPIGFLHRLIWIHVPNGLAAVDRRVTGGRLGSSVRRMGNYLMYEKHPIVLIFFLGLLVISELVFIPAAIPLLPTTFPYDPLLHCMLIALLITPPYLFLYLSYSTPSTITPENHSFAMLSYPPDHTIFHAALSRHAQLCRSCHRAKPARSKHCRICRSCIQKADHHCIWINNCVGRNNYVHFLGLMFSLSVLLAYAAYLGYRILDTQLQLRHSNPTSNNSDPHWSENLPWRSFAAQYSIAIALHPLIAAPALMALLSSPLAAGLSLYHVYLIWAGMTTNESGKWADLGADIAEGRVWRGGVDELAVDFPELDTGPGGTFEWPLRPRWTVVRMEEPGRRPRIRRRRREMAAKDEGTDGRTGSRQEQEEDESAQWEDDNRWTLVASLSEIENIYDLGFWDNFMDVLLNRE